MPGYRRPFRQVQDWRDMLASYLDDSRAMGSSHSDRLPAGPGPLDLIDTADPAEPNLDPRITSEMYAPYDHSKYAPFWQNVLGPPSDDRSPLVDYGDAPLPGSWGAQQDFMDHYRGLGGAPLGHREYLKRILLQLLGG